MIYELRDYQNQAAEKALSNFDKYDKPFVLVLPTGSGKSLVISDICHKLNQPILILQPTKEILEQNYEKLLSYGITDIGIYSASFNSKEINKFTYATIGSIYKKPELFQHFKYVLIDECFPAGTLVDNMPIEKINIGDIISSFNHMTNRIEKKKVIATSKREPPNKLILINSFNVSILSTLNHPYYVKDRGYTKAQDIKIGDYLYAIKTKSNKRNSMFRVWRDGYSKRLSPVLAVQTNGQNLSQTMLSKIQCSEFFSSYAEEKSYDEPNYSGENGSYPTQDRAQTTDTRWEWSRIIRTTKEVVGQIRGRMVRGIGSEDKFETEKRLSLSLQNRYCESSKDDSNRGGRKFSFLKKTRRSEERRSFEFIRVESIEIREQRSDGRFSNGYQYDYIYNLEVEDNNNYFANGILVHNCHLVNPKNLEGMYNQFFKAIDCKNICGLTATPYRMIQKYYTNPSGDLIYTAYIQTINRIYPFFFKKFAHITTIQELLDRDYLCRYDYKFYDDFDISGVKINTTGADFDERSLEKFWDDKRLKKLANVIGEVDNNCRHNLIFCSSIRQAKRCSELLKELGFSSDYITSEHGSKERDSLIAKFRSGEIKHLANVGVLTVGFDFPSLDSITLARPTLSLALLYQMSGRGMRKDPNRPEKICQIVDITENIKKMGRIETIALAKEEGGFKDIVVTEMGEITNKPLFSFKLKDKAKIAQITGTN